MTEPGRMPHNTQTTLGADAALEAQAEAINGAALAPMSLYRSLAQESLQFWARRLQAYAAWAEAAATSRTPQEMMEAQTAFMAQIQQDYAEEGAAMASLMRSGLPGGDPSQRS